MENLGEGCKEMNVSLSVANRFSTKRNHPVTFKLLRFVSGYIELGNANRSTLLSLFRSRTCHKS